jgi:hypothetical protein
MGERQNRPFQLSSNSSLKVDFQGSRVTSDSGLILVRELDERRGFGDLVAQHLTDSRRGKNTPLPLADLLRQSVYSRTACYEDVNRSLARINRELIAKAEAIDTPQRIVLDMDSTEIPVYGQQESSVYNGHFESTCYHRCCCSIGKATARRRNCGPAMCTVLASGKNCCCRRSSSNGSWAKRWSFGPMPPLPSRRFTKLWKSAA